MLDKAYDPKKYEQDIYKFWESKKVFSPKKSENDAGTHVNILPPPNANGSLHLGHASGYTIMDIAGRYARMLGKETLLLPGKDHAGILTQVVFERKLLEEKGISRYDLGREKFYKDCYDFCIDSAHIMRSQEKRIGLSADWSREKFTLDPEISKEVLETFVQMYKDGIAYRGNRIINWCPFCQTALSDMEVEHKDQISKLYWIKYGPFTLATTRPETKLGDTAVAVHPDDERYKHMVGKKYKIPGVLGEFEITVVADEAVDPTFGSGAIKVTPAHSITDFEIAERHGIAKKMIIGKDGKMMENCGKYAGLTTKECRKAIAEDMQAMGLIEKIDENYANKISVHDRCGHTIEPLISDQWWVNTDHEKFSMKKEAIKAIKEKRIKIVPENFEKTFMHWMENLQDWCISRQIWWSHRIPAYFCKDCGHIEVTQGEKTEIYYLRHGETDANKNKVIQGQSMNLPLNENGVKQAESMVDTITKLQPDIIICSPLLRAQQTAEIACKNLPMSIIHDDRLLEQNLGDYCGLDRDTLLKNYGEEAIRYMNFQDIPNGETFVSVQERLKHLFDDIQKKYPGKKVLLVAHGAILRILWHTEKGMNTELASSKYIPNCTFEKFTRYSEPQVCPKCSSHNFTQDEDTFDTWFSSGQWAHNTVCTFGEDQYFPGDFMVMGRDILFFWACRMIMMSLYTKKEVPFKTLYLTGLITDRHGKKMSKSKGNGIDPLEMIDTYGTDALRLSLFIGSSAGNDMRLYEEKIEGFRNFVNKLWNASRFVQMSTEGKNIDRNAPLLETDTWILHRLNELTGEVRNALDNYRYGEAGQKLYDFTWNEFCDWYLELSKGEKQNPWVLQEVLKNLLLLLHPFIPFVTEVLAKELNFSETLTEKTLALSEYPKQNPEWNYPESKENISLLIDIISAIRKLRTEHKIEGGKKIEAVLVCSGHEKVMAETYQAEIIKLAKLSHINFAENFENKDALSTILSSTLSIFIPQDLEIDSAKEQERIAKEKEELLKLKSQLEGRLSSPAYREKAPAALVADTEKKLEEVVQKLGKMI